MEKQVPHDYMESDSSRRQIQSMTDRYNKQKNTIQGQCLLLDSQ